MEDSSEEEIEIIENEIMEDSSEEEIETIENEEIRQNLVESGVIGRVLNDFLPCMLLHIIYQHDKLITLGDQLWVAQVQTRPDVFNCYADDTAPEFLEAEIRPKLIIVMTDPDGPGGEYLHAIFSSFSIEGHGDEVIFWPELVVYDPPRTPGRMIVFTLYTVPASQNIVPPYLRENFSTRAFADRNAFGPPLTASYFYTKRENEGQINGNGNNESPTCNKKELTENGKQSTAYALTRPMGARKKVFKMLKQKGSQPISLPTSLEKKGFNVEIADSPTGSSGLSSYKREENHES